MVCFSKLLNTSAVFTSFSLKWIHEEGSIICLTTVVILTAGPQILAPSSGYNRNKSYSFYIRCFKIDINKLGANA